MRKLNLLGITALAVWAAIGNPVLAQDVQEEEASESEAATTKSARQIKLETINSDLKLRMDFKETEGIHSEGKLSIVPVPILNPTLKAGLGVAGLYTFGSGGRRSTLFAGGGATGNGSWLVGTGGNLWLGGDRIKVEVAGGYGSFKLKYFGEGGDSILRENPINFTGEGWVVQVNPEIEVVDNFYLGVIGRYLDADIVTKIPIEVIPDLSVPFRIYSGGATAEYISTDYPNWPTTGTHVVGKLLFSKETLKIFNLGINTKFKNFDVTGSTYFGLAENVVLALNGRVAGADDNTPFFLKPSVSLRGYQSGEVLNNYVIEGQTELRWMFSRKFGAVAFAGLSASGLEFDSFGKATAAYGAGVRYRYSEIDKANVGFDFAKAGKNFSVLFSLGEAF